MDIKVYNSRDYKESKWSGGNTREMAIFPENSEYLDRDFIWRLSSADSELEESSFTKLPDYDRILMVLEGSVVLAHGDERSARLGPLEQDCFDGSIKTKCFGTLKKDYNLIMRKGCRGKMCVIEPESTGVRTDIDTDTAEGESISAGIYCLEGYAVVSAGGRQVMVREDEQLVCSFEKNESPEMTVMGEGKCIFTQVVYAADDFICEEVPPEKASVDDFKTAYMLAFDNNRWSKIMRRHGGRKASYYKDPVLAEKLRKLEKHYITMIVWIIEMCICFLPAFLGVSLEKECIIAGIVSLIHIFLIGPLVYMILLPKPIRAHMKRPEELNAMERNIYMKQNGEDERMDRLMKKYSSTDDEYFADTDSPLYKFMKRNDR